LKENKSKSWFSSVKDAPDSPLKGRKGLLLLVVVLLALLLMNLDGFARKPGVESPPRIPETPAGQEALRGELELAGRLKKVLADISGVGRVEVLLTLERGSEYLYARTADRSSKETREEDSSGGTRLIQESVDRSQLVLTRSPQGHEEPVLITEVFPVIKGVVVVAQGAQDPRIKERITRAVQTALGVGPHKITVLPMGQ